jgi:hypothetical protein
MTLTDKELDAVIGLLSAVMNDDAGLETYGMSAQELAALRRGFTKLVRESNAR